MGCTLCFFLILPLSAFANYLDKPREIAYSGPRYAAEVRNLNWNPSKGWNGLLPDKSRLTNAKLVLGKVTSTEKNTIGTLYRFKIKSAELFVKKDKKTISSITVYPTDRFLRETPFTAKDAKTMYSPLSEVKGPGGTSCLQRDGLLIETTDNSDTGQVITLRFSNSIKGDKQL